MTHLTTTLLALAACSAALAQNTPPTTFARAYYLKTKPGKSADHREFSAKLAPKGAAAIINNGRATAYASLRRVFPTGNEAGHDFLYFYVSNTPPDLDAPPNDVFDKAIGMTQAEGVAKRASMSDLVKAEIWTSVYKHGALQTGDFVRIDYLDPPQDKHPDFLAFQREYESKMRETLVKSGAVPGLHMWGLSLTPEAAPYNYISMAVRKDSASLFRPLGSQTKTFADTFPTGSYNTYIERYRTLRTTARTVVYRVDAAIWK